MPLRPFRSLVTAIAAMCLWLGPLSPSANANTTASAAGTTIPIAGNFSNLTFTGSVNDFPIDLRGFNPSLGTLNSVQLSLTVTVDTSAELLNTVELLVGIIPTPIVVVGSEQVIDNPITLTEEGTTLITTAAASSVFPFAIPPQSVMTVATEATGEASAGVPEPEIGSFITPTVILGFSDQELGRNPTTHVRDIRVLGASCGKYHANSFARCNVRLYTGVSAGAFRDIDGSDRVCGADSDAALRECEELTASVNPGGLWPPSNH